MPIDPMMGFKTPTTAAPSFWDRLQSGLLGPSQSYGGLLSPEDQAAARRQAMMSFGTQMMQAGGYSQTPVSFGQALASGIQAGQQGQKSNIDDRLQAMLVATQLQKAKQKPQRKPIGILDEQGRPIYVDEENAIGHTPLPSSGASQSPLLQAYDVAKTQGYTKSLLEFQKELATAQASYPYTVSVINGVATLVDRTGAPINGVGGQAPVMQPGAQVPPQAGPQVAPPQAAPPQAGPQASRTIPLTTLPQEAAAQGTLANAKAEGTATGTTIGTSQATAQIDLPRAIDNAQQGIDAIEKLKNHPGLRYITGAYSVAPVVPGTPQADAAALADQVEGKTFLEAYNTLRGGGQITEVEGKKATDAIGRLNRSQSRHEYVGALNDLESVVKAGLQRAKTKSGVTQSQDDPLGLRSR